MFAFIVGFALDLGGAVCAMIFLLILFIGGRQVRRSATKRAASFS